MDKTTPELDLPGFRFHPTEEELLDFYLKNIHFGKKLRFDIIGFLNIYHHDPWELPGLAKIGEREWYFFVPRNRKHGNGGRPNRTTEHGYWKATGSDRTIRSLSDPKRVIGLKKTLVFYQGRAPRGSKTDWVMNEYRMPNTCNTLKEDIVLCKIYRKATSMKVLEQRAAMEEETKTPLVASSPPTTMDSTVSFHGQEKNFAMPMPVHDIVFKTEKEEEEEEAKNKEEDAKDINEASSSLQIGSMENLTDLQVPKFNLDWTQDPFWTQLRSPWLDNWTPYANVLNF
ncbi:hypothetical protein HHK36_031115 [Tetracentron sinense]|uniref:NAC domain-containing protein n=1 Tax=Tetracentron sinense TaxID=13715 RepID=A0A834YDC5_TETSI|nr:hypothetical protein HHK36_031115 [Tetracentron sinense]